MNDSHLIEKKKSSELIFNGRVFSVYRDEVYLPNGSVAGREYLRCRDAVCVVPLTDSGEVILVRQFRYPDAMVTTEIPAGKMEPDEEPEICAARELSEETGLTAENYTYLGVIQPSPAILGEHIHMFLATGLTSGKPHTDEDEFLDVFRVPLADLVRDIMENKIKDAKTQIAVLKAHVLGMK